MPSYIAAAFLAATCYLIITRLLSLQSNVRKAKASGIPYLIVPVFFLDRTWLVLHRGLFPILRPLPRWMTWWVDFCLPNFTFEYRREIFERVGHDTFLTVSPGGICMYTADPGVISTITIRRNDFPKPGHIYESVNIYGTNVVSAEGQLWRRHRKAISPPFTEKNNHIVWDESIRQAQSMLQSWLKEKTIDRIVDDTMRLSLNVISAAGFGRRMKWPTSQTVPRDDMGHSDPSKIKNEEDDIDPGHSMSYTYALHSLLDHILLQFLVPRWLLKKAPNKTLKTADRAYEEFKTYMKEMITRKKTDLQSGQESKEQMDILAQLVKGQLVDLDKKNGTPLTEEELLGNMFVLILAGHETAANSIHFIAIYMALYPATQRVLQKDLDEILQGRPPSEWDYDRDLPQLFGSMPGAVLAEELRVLPPVVGIPKSTYFVSEQRLMVDGKECVVPANTYIELATGTVQRHPDYWPKGKSGLPGGRPAHPLSNVDNDLEEFKPERWLLNEANGAPVDKNGIPVETADDLGVNESSDTSDRLYKPQKGSYLPFSDGYRACLGRRFAQVEVLAVISVIFQKYSLELAVDKYAKDEEMERMSIEEKAEIWHKAAEDTRDLMLNGMGVIITLQIRRGMMHWLPVSNED